LGTEAESHCSRPETPQPWQPSKTDRLVLCRRKTIKGMKQGNPWTLFEIIGLGVAGIEPPELWNT